MEGKDYQEGRRNQKKGAGLTAMFSVLRFAVFYVLLTAALPMNLFSLCASGSELPENIVSTGDGCFTCFYDGVKHDFIVDLPEKPKGSGLIVMLHGYGSTAETFRRDTGFHKAANAQGYTVVYVTGAPGPDRTSATGWNYETGGSGNSDPEFLCALVNYLRQQYHTDEKKSIAVGYSNGGFMCHRLAAEAAETFSCIVCVAGTMPESVWKSRPEKCSVSLLQITGEKDNAIPKNSDGSARYAKSPAIEDVIEYYAAANGLDHSVTEKIGNRSVLTKYCGNSAYRQVWHLVVKDGHHSWPGENTTGINTNQLILDFINAAG